MSQSNTEGKNPEYVARGLKAAIHNDGVSEEAKNSAAQRLQDMGAEVPEDYNYDAKGGSNSGSTGRSHTSRDNTDTGSDGVLNPNQERGYKATLKNPNVSEEAKQHAEQVLEENGTSY